MYKYTVSTMKKIINDVMKYKINSYDMGKDLSMYTTFSLMLKNINPNRKDQTTNTSERSFIFFIFIFLIFLVE